ncbi:MAG: c-type cytochrome [Planctomycetota bacterium]
MNHLRLKLDDGQEVRRVTAPRNDVAQKVQWDLQDWVGKTGRLEIVDGDAGSAFAWIGAGLFEPAVVAAPSAEALSNSGSRDVALRICELLNIEAERPVIEALVGDRTLATELRTLALQTSFTLNRSRATPQCTSLALDGTESPVLRAKAAELLMAVNTEETRATLAATLATSAGALQQQVATALATSPAGVQTLLQTISLGKASPRLLQDKTILDRLALDQHPDLARQVNSLTKDLPAADERVRQLVAQRLTSFQAAPPSLERGAAVFKKQCATCHRVAGEGAMIGPQLDGVGVRGAERLLEDILDPSRNVDAAFRVTIITTTDGQVITGIKLREEGQTVVLADQQGKERRVELGQIDEQRQSALSLMPTNVTDPLSEQESRDLLGYLLQQKTRRGE